MKKLIFLIVFALNISLHSQLANGSTAPDFTLTDYFGTTHNLYSYLDAGKTVFLKIFAAHCPGCWSYHQTDRLKNIYNMYGPGGTDEVMVLALEHDQWNDTNAFIGNGPAWVTQGNWLAGTPFPIFDVEDPDRGVFTDYNVTFYPVIYKICPDRIIERILTTETESQLYQKVQDCQASISIEENPDVGRVYIDALSNNLVIEQYQKVRSLVVLNISGKIIMTSSTITSSMIDLGELSTGVYIFEINTEGGPVIKKFYVN